MHKVRWLAALLAAHMALSAAAAAQAQDTLTLADAVHDALEHNAALRAEAAEVVRNEAAVAEARAAWWPRVSVAERWQRGNQPIFVFSSLLAARLFGAENFAIDALNHPEALGFHQASVGIEQLVFDGGARTAGIDIARLQQQIAGYGLDESRAQVAAATAAAYGRILAAEANRRAAEAALRAARQDRTRTEERRDAGMATDADVLSLAAHMADLEGRIVQLEGDAAVARAELNRLTGAPITRDFRVVEEAPRPAAATAGQLEALLDEAEDARPELKRAIAQDLLAQSEGRRARAGWLPQVAAQGAVEFSGTSVNDRTSQWIVGAEARWSLSLGGAERARSRAAAAGRARADADAEAIRAAVQVEIVTAFRQLASAEARRTASQAAVDQARESDRIVRNRFDAGLATVADVLRTSSALLDAEAQRTAATVDAIVSAANLDRAVGRVPSRRTP